MMQFFLNLEEREKSEINTFRNGGKYLLLRKMYGCKIRCVYGDSKYSH